MTNETLPMKKIFIYIAVLGLGACTSVKVTHLSKSSKPFENQGILFALPKTIIKVEVSIKKTQRFKGPFSEYADKYLGLQNVIKTDQTVFSIEDAKLTSITEPDSSQLYFISKPFSYLKLDFDENGSLQSANNFEKQKFQKNIKPKSESKTSLYSDVFKYYADNNLFEKIDTVTEEVHADTASFLKQVLKKTLVQKPIVQRVEEAADYILKVRQNRLNILSAMSEVAFSKESIAYMSEQLERIENEYMTLFTGIIDEKIETLTFFIEPNPNQATYPVFVFSPSEGIVANVSDKSSTVVLQINSEKTYGKISNQFSAKHYSNGFPVRVGELAEVTLKSSISNLAYEKILVLQDGMLYRIPFKKHFRFNTFSTGMMKYIKM